MTITPDQIVLWQEGPLALTATVVFSWVVMALLATGAWLVTRRLSDTDEISRWQSLLEVLVSLMREQIQDVSRAEPGRYLPFIGTLFLFIATCNTVGVVPGFRSPTGSLSTTTALAICVLVAVPLYAIADSGIAAYVRKYLEPTPFMLPFNVISEFSRTLALAVRLYGNVMSGAIIAAILLGIAPFFFPVLMDLFGLLIGLIQAYIFAVLAMVYIASAARPRAGNGQSGEAPLQDTQRNGGRPWTSSP